MAQEGIEARSADEALSDDELENLIALATGIGGPFEGENMAVVDGRIVRRKQAVGSADRSMESKEEVAADLQEVRGHVEAVTTEEEGYMNNGRWEPGWNILLKRSSKGDDGETVESLRVNPKLAEFDCDAPTVTEVFDLKGLHHIPEALRVLKPSNWKETGVDLKDPTAWELVRPATLKNGKLRAKGEYRLKEETQEKLKEIVRVLEEERTKIAQLWNEGKIEQYEADGQPTGMVAVQGPFGWSCLVPDPKHPPENASTIAEHFVEINREGKLRDLKGAMKKAPLRPIPFREAKTIANRWDSPRMLGSF